MAVPEALFPTAINITGLPEPLQLFSQNMQALFSTLVWFIGGVLGLYVLYLFFFVMQWRERYKTRKALYEIKDDLKAIKSALKIEHNVSSAVLSLKKGVEDKAIRHNKSKNKKSQK